MAIAIQTWKKDCPTIMTIATLAELAQPKKRRQPNDLQLVYNGPGWDLKQGFDKVKAASFSGVSVSQCGQI